MKSISDPPRGGSLASGVEGLVGLAQDRGRPDATAVTADPDELQEDRLQVERALRTITIRQRIGNYESELVVPVDMSVLEWKAWLPILAGRFELEEAEVARHLETVEALLSRDFGT